MPPAVAVLYYEVGKGRQADLFPLEDRQAQVDTPDRHGLRGVHVSLTKNGVRIFLFVIEGIQVCNGGKTELQLLDDGNSGEIYRAGENPAAHQVEGRQVAHHGFYAQVGKIEKLAVQV
jgi:hypothetical protein